jgi:hypothetical protein
MLYLFTNMTRLCGAPNDTLGVGISRQKLLTPQYWRFIPEAQIIKRKISMPSTSCLVIIRKVQTHIQISWPHNSNSESMVDDDEVVVEI